MWIRATVVSAIGLAVLVIVGLKASGEESVSTTNSLEQARWVEVMGGTAMLDRETGLVWEIEPAHYWSSWWVTDHALFPLNEAEAECLMMSKGRGLGWRLPSVDEMGGAVERTALEAAAPVGSPFSKAEPGTYWTSSMQLHSDDHLWGWNIPSATLADMSRIEPDLARVWCVRGPYSSGSGVH